MAREINSVLNQVRDNATGATKVIEVDGERTNEGKSYVVSGRFTSITSGSTRVIHVKTNGDDTNLSSLLLSSDKLPVKVQIFENADNTSDGSSVSVFDKNRITANTASATVFTGPTINTDGTEVLTYTEEGSNKVNIVSDVLFGTWVLKSGTSYNIKITNESNSTANISWGLRFFQLS